MKQVNMGQNLPMKYETADREDDNLVFLLTKRIIINVMFFSSWQEFELQERIAYYNINRRAFNAI